MLCAFFVVPGMLIIMVIVSHVVNVALSNRLLVVHFSFLYFTILCSC